MDKRILALEESHFKSNFVASSSRSSGLVKINSIEIGLNRPTEEEMDTPDVHEHFSMRGFVAGIRKKDITVCYPFSTSQTASMANLEESLPPLHTPSFRWWQCSTCVPDNVVERNTLAMVVAERFDDAAASASQNRGNDGLSSQKDIGNKEKSDCKDARPDTSRAKLFRNNKRNHNSADASDVLTISERSFSKANEPANASSSSDGAVNPLPRRRKPKLRSLADINMEERNPPTENRRPKSASSSGLQTTSTDYALALRNSEMAQGIKTHKPKRKFGFEEETGPQGKFYPSGSLKRFKGQMPEVESTSRRIESSNLESRGDALEQMNVEHWSKSGSTNGKKRKAIDVGKKVRINQTGTVKVADKEFQKANLMGSGSFKKQDASNGPSFSRPRGMVPSFKNSLSGKQSETDSGLSKSKRPGNEASRSNVGDFSDNAKAALDLSVNSFASYERNLSSRPDRNIPDLNETFTHNSSAMRGKQSSSVSENVLPINKNLDISASCSKATIREGKRPVSDQQMPHKSNSNELGASEDITMEIVELLAKNKLENSRRHLLPDHGINNSVPLPNGRYPVQHPILPFPGLPNRNAQAVRNVNNRVDKNYTPSFSHPNKSPLDMGKLESSRFSLFPPSQVEHQGFSQQKNALYSSLSSKMSMPGGRSDHVWPPRQPNAPFHLTVPQNHNHTFQANSTLLPSFSNRSHKGKTFSDIKGNEEKIMMNGSFMPKERQNWPNPTSVGSLDPYSNDAIPATQLLSLMDQIIPSGSSLKIGPPKNFMNKTFAPCSNHPPANRNENQNVLNGLFASQNGQYKDLLQSCYGVGPAVEKNSSSYLHRPIPYEKGSAKGVQMAGSSSVAIEKATSKSPLRICTLNRNPADFSFPGERIEFTISSKDLKFRKRSGAKGNLHSVNVGSQKKQRPRKMLEDKLFVSSLFVVCFLKFVSDGSPSEGDKKRLKRPRRMKTYIVAIKYATKIYTMSIANGILLVRQSFHNEPRNFVLVGGGIVGCRGFYSSFRATRSGLSLNMDVTTTMTVKPGPVIGFLLENQSVPDPSMINWESAKRTLKNRSIKAVKTNLEYKIRSFSDKICKQQMFSMGRRGDGKRETEMSVYDYFVRDRKIPLQCSVNFPCITYIPKRPTYLPLSFANSYLSNGTPKQ